MPTIDFHHPHPLGKETCRSAVDAATRDLAARYGLGGMDWTGDTLAFTGNGVNGKLTVADHDVHVCVELGGLLGLMRPLIEAEIRRGLDERLG